MESRGGPFAETELTAAQRYKRAALDDMNAAELLHLIEEVEDEIRKRGALAPGLPSLDGSERLP